MICKNCGAEIKDTMKFCNHCGARVVPAVQAAPEEAKRPPRIQETAQLPKPDAAQTTREEAERVPQKPRTEQRSTQEAKQPERAPAPEKVLDRSNPKSKAAAGILTLLLGFFGVQWFYLGKPVRGVCYLTVYLLSALLFLPLAAVWYVFLVGEAIFFFAAKPERVERYTGRAIRRKR